ncbi:sodium:proton antiporter [Denitratisoma oestradiolicum]|nr:sodium:proton antiporter [Denitratisoma oestradiolicum]
MPDYLSSMIVPLAWPLALLVAWLAGEAGQRWLALPRVSSYGLVGFLMAEHQVGILGKIGGDLLSLVADVAFGLILFELGYRINLRWLRSNPWLGVSSLAESFGSFVVVFVLAQGFGLALVPSLLLAALAMSTSPASVLRVVNDLRASGQVTERVLHLSAFNCVLAVVAFKAVVGYWVLATAGSIFHALWNSLAVVVVSAGLGVMFGVMVPALLRLTRTGTRDATVLFALAVLLLVVLTHGLRFSPLLATLAFGLVSRHRRVVFSQAQRNFGTLGNLLTLFLFVFAGATLDWRDAVAGFWLAMALVAGRLAVKVTAVAMFARLAGLSWRKGVLTGFALTPLSVFAILLLEQTKHLGVGLVDDLAPLAALVLLLDLIGPIVTQRALIWAGEAPFGKES